MGHFGKSECTSPMMWTGPAKATGAGRLLPPVEDVQLNGTESRCDRDSYISHNELFLALPFLSHDCLFVALK